MLNGTEAFTNYFESFFTSAPTCNKNITDDRSNEQDHSSNDTGCNEESCCSGSSMSSAYLVQHGLSYSPCSAFKQVPMAHVVNHYRTSYLSTIWRPPAHV